MSEYLVETYVSGRAAIDSVPRPEALSRAADQSTADGESVRLTQAILVPEDETGFFLFEAQSARSVLQVAERAGLHVDRIVEAISI